MPRLLLFSAGFVLALGFGGVAWSAPDSLGDFGGSAFRYGEQQASACGRGLPSSGFFRLYAKHIAFFAHPTAKFTGSYVQMRGRAAYLTLYFRSRWTGKRLYVDLKIVSSRYFGVTRLQVLRYNAFIPPFSGISLLRRFVVTFFKDELTRTKNPREARRIRSILNRLNRIKGRHMCLMYLAYRWSKF